MFGNDFGTIKRRKTEIRKCDFPFGTNSPLLAKSKKYGNTKLKRHLIDAARMSLTACENIIIRNHSRELVRKTVFIGGLFHDLGKAAAGFQEMIKNDNVKHWPASSRGNRHEILSSVILSYNLTNLNGWKQNKFALQAMHLAVVVHHKPYRRKLSQYPKIINLNQWPSNLQFLQMYDELLCNKELIEHVWEEIVSELKNDSWGAALFSNEWLPSEISIPSVEEITRHIKQFDKEFQLPGYKDGEIDVDKFNSIADQDRLFISIIRALITVGDHLSSGENNYIPPVPELSQYQVFDDDKIIPRNFQNKCRQTKGNLLLRAPTGSGKTEAAYFWIMNNQLTRINGEDYLGKIFFILPFQASINAMFERVNKVFEVDHGLIGLQHARAAFILFSIVEEEIYGEDTNDKSEKQLVSDFINPPEVKIKTLVKKPFTDLIYYSGNKKKMRTHTHQKELSLESNNLAKLTREIFYPIKISTPHQLLKASLQGRGWEAYIADFEDACIVFDEIHAYDPHLTGLVLSLAKLLIDVFNAKILFMSASFPTFLIDLIKKNVDPNIPLIELDAQSNSDGEILEKKRHLLKISDSTLTEIITYDKNVINKIKQSESTLIICNTVATAQNTYELIKSKLKNFIKEDEIILFHSRFRIGDRREKEKQMSKINKGSNVKVVVATQVVEVSLDIDLAFGIFESAPLDALVQRLGRVNRRGKRDINDYNILLTKPEGYSYLIYEEELTKYSLELLRTVEGQKISETFLVQLVDNLYQNHPWSDREVRDFNKAFNHTNLKNFMNKMLPGSYKRWVDHVIQDQTTVDVLLSEDLSKYKKLRKEAFLQATKLIIPVRVRRDEIDSSNDRFPPVLKIKYNYSEETGLHIKRKK